MAVSKQTGKKKPVIAILTVADNTRPLRGNLLNFIDLIRTGDELGAIVYVTTIDDLKLSQKKITGQIYDPQNKVWIKQLFPLPQVIYNRIPYRKFEFRPEVQQVLQSCLKHRSIRLFNPSFFNKWTLFEWLSESDVTYSFIPHTEKLNSWSNLESLFRQHPTLYLKPVRGKAGKGIMLVSRKGEPPDAEYLLVHHRNKQRKLSKFTSIYELWKKLSEEIGSTEYIVQQGISLTRFKNRPFDLRLLVQKNQKGSWGVTGIGARVAGKMSITTHVPRGGSIDDPEKLLISWFGSQRGTKIMQEAGKTALLIAKQIEKASGQNMGEMSMDLGVDTDGELWFFEANSKPMKFDEPHIRKKSLQKVIQYCMYLSRKSPHKVK